MAPVKLLEGARPAVESYRRQLFATLFTKFLETLVEISHECCGASSGAARPPDGDQQDFSKGKLMLHRCFLLILPVAAIVASTGNYAAAQNANVGYIQWRDSNIPNMLEALTTHFPVATFEHVTLQNNIGDHGLDAVVNEMEATVNDMKSRGIDRILVGASSAETGPFIEGSAGTLGDVHSDLRHPDVIFSADRQGTTSVDNAQNWYRAGIDFVTDKELGAPILLPDVTGITPQPQFILATDNSPGVDQANVPFTAQATAAGYDVINVDLGWNEATDTYDSFAALGPVIAAATPNSKVGLSASAAPSSTGQPFARWVELTELGLADSSVFESSNGNVEYLGMNYAPFRGDFDDPGSIPVDVKYGVVPASELISDPNGVNDILLELGYPDDPVDARIFDDVEYEGSGVVSAAAFAWLVTDGESNLDARHLIDDNRQLVTYYVEDFSFPAGNTWDEPVTENLRVNPRWTAIVPEPTSLTLGALAAVGLLGFRRRLAGAL